MTIFISLLLALMPLPFDDSGLAPAGYTTLCQLPVQSGGGFAFPPASYSFPVRSHTFTGPGYSFPILGSGYYNVKDYGARGDGSHDDTVALRNLITHAVSETPPVSILYFPTGTYNVCPQAGDPANPAGGRLIFDLSGVPSTSQLVLIGDGPTLSILKGFMPGLANPVTTWDVVNGQISRFMMFQTFTTVAAAGKLQIRSMTVDGQAGWTGDYTVGGSETSVSAAVSAGGTGYAVNDVLTLSNSSVIGGQNATYKVTSTSGGIVTGITQLTAGVYGFISASATATTGGTGTGCTLVVTKTKTGDGWDTFHKCVRTDGSQAIGDILIFNSKLINWRGEIVYAGGGAARNIASVISTIDQSNASVISCSTAYLSAYDTVGPNVYNGCENFCINGNQSLTADHSSFTGKNYGMVYLGVQGSHADIGNCTISGSLHDMLVSELGWDMNIHDNNFTNTSNGWINSTLGLYPQYGRGYGNITFNNNTFVGNSTPIFLGDNIDNLVLTNNTCGGLAYIDVPNVTERWTMSESSSGSSPVTRAGSMSTGPTINPGRISITDTTSTPSITLPGGVAANFTSGEDMTTEATNAAGRIDNNIFIGTISWSVFFRGYWSSLPGSTGYAMHRDLGNSWGISINSSHKMALSSVLTRALTLLTTTSTVVLQVNREYSFVVGYDGVNDRQFVHVVDDTGALTHTYSATGIGRRNPYTPGGIILGGGDRSQPMGGAMRDMWWFKSAIDDTTIMKLHNSGSPLTVTGSRVLLSPKTSGWWPRPFNILSTVSNFDTTANITASGGSANGAYFYRPYPLITWSPSLAAVHGNYVWLHSSDHSATNTNLGAGVWMGFSGDPSVRPTSWTQILPGTGTDNDGVGYVQLETPHLSFYSGMFYLSAHGDDSTNLPPGLLNPQETRIWTSTDLATWTMTGKIPAQADGTSIAKNHTGYAVTFPPGELPNQTDWRAYHLGNDAFAVNYCTPSSDGLVYLTGDDKEELDQNGPFPAGFDNVDWSENIFTPDGVKVYSFGRAFLPGGRGTIIAELSFENGAWRLPTGRVWKVTTDTDVFPTIGYTQHAKGWLDPVTKILHCYILRGFFKTNGGDERIDYLKLQF